MIIWFLTNLNEGHLYIIYKQSMREKQTAILIDWMFFVLLRANKHIFTSIRVGFVCMSALEVRR